MRMDAMLANDAKPSNLMSREVIPMLYFVMMQLRLSLVGQWLKRSPLPWVTADAQEGVGWS